MGRDSVSDYFPPDDNRSQFHTVHHKNVKLNFGQYLPLWDHLAGTYADPVKYFQAGKIKI